MPTLIDGTGAHPKAMGAALPHVGAALNRSFLNVVGLVTQAALDEDRRLIHQAMMVDPNAAASLTLPVIDELFEAMTHAHGDLLPAWVQG
ncbi:MAG: hypothetical protein V9E81_04720 [Marmoricola sp.]